MPAAVGDAHLRGLLWELIHALAGRRIYLRCTDHLGDRALYGMPWKKGLREEAILPGRSCTGGYFYDTIGRYGSEDMEIFHRCCEPAESRARHLAEYLNEQIPARETPPFSRDWRLPKEPF